MIDPNDDDDSTASEWSDSKTCCKSMTHGNLSSSRFSLYISFLSFSRFIKTGRLLLRQLLRQCKYAIFRMDLLSSWEETRKGKHKERLRKQRGVTWNSESVVLLFLDLRFRVVPSEVQIRGITVPVSSGSWLIACKTKHCLIRQANCAPTSTGEWFVEQRETLDDDISCSCLFVMSLIPLFLVEMKGRLSGNVRIREANVIQRQREMKDRTEGHHKHGEWNGWWW